MNKSFFKQKYDIKIISNWYLDTWDTWEYSSPKQINIYTDYNLEKVDLNIPIRIAWILESPGINITDYDWIEHNNNKFTYVFTHQKYLLDRKENFIYCPCAHPMINEKNIYPKTKLLSIIASSKNDLVGHKLRHEIIDRHKGKFDLFGNSGVGVNTIGGYNPIDNKIIGLQEYAFSIVIENNKSDYYWTEKILDCFLTGTVPIYWGCPSIGNFFNINGIITFNDIDELDDIFKNLSFEKYQNMKYAVMENFEICKKYYTHKEFILNNYSYLFSMDQK